MKALLSILLFTVFCGFSLNTSASTDTIANDHNGPLTVELFAGIADKHIQPNGVRMYNHVLGTAGLHIWHHETGIYLESLSRAGFDQKHTHGQENELDVGIGINRKIFEKFRFDLSLTYDHSIHMGSATLDDFMKIGFVFGLDAKEYRRNMSISPYIGLQAFVALKDKSKHIEDGMIWTLAGMDIKWKHPKFLMVYTPSLAWDDGFMKARPGFVLSNTLNITYNLTEQLHLKLGATGIISRQPVAIVNFSVGFEF